VTSTAPARTRHRHIRIHRIRVAGVLLAIVAIAVGVARQLPAPSPSPPPPGSSWPATTASSSVGAAHPARRGALGEADGAVPDGTTVFDDDVPGVARLDPALLGALREAATAAATTGVEFHVDSGWRSPDYQEQLLREATATHGSEAEAARWVAPPDRSEHVSGNAVDIGPTRAAAWLSAHGAAYGLCPVYGNEPWHYELRPEAPARGCPPMYADPTRDPRLHG
jgi:hypothetical protein